MRATAAAAIPPWHPRRRRGLVGWYTSPDQALDHRSGGKGLTCAKAYDRDTRSGGEAREVAMRPRWHRTTPVVWSSSAGPRDVPVGRRIRRRRRRVLRRRIRTGALIAIIGLIRLARVVRARPGLAFLLAGALLSVAGNMLSSGIAFIAGMLVFLRGAAVLLGVTEPRRPGGQQAGRADFFGFGTPPRGRGKSGRAISCWRDAPSARPGTGPADPGAGRGPRPR